ncbi:MAG: methyltransferase domain-containing protein [Verrucomicrobiae bacterium]|nr:methyltransferase domain-containing protein [Verrucomicrobiae bacterium]NNJ43628.1 methyltransferase domain-containing protein [Akkermansiaceae bacterium]
MTDWNDRYLKDDCPWDKGAAAPALVEILHQGTIPSHAQVLVPGCGLGHDVRAMGSAGYRATGMDIAPRAVETARAMADDIGGDMRVDFIQGDFFDPSWAEKKRYDVIWEHTCYCAILPEQRAAYVEAAYRLLKPNGLLLGVFFAFGEDESGPPYKTRVNALHRQFGTHFTLEWERAPAQFFPSRKGAEWLMCLRRKESA